MRLCEPAHAREDMSCNFCRDNFTAYLQDELRGAQKARFDAHLQSCPECARDLERFRVAVEAVRALPQVAPPADLLARIDAALDDAPVPLPVGSAPAHRAWSWQHAGGFALAACLLVTFVAILRTGRLTTGGGPAVTPPVVSRVPATPPAPASTPQESLPPRDTAEPRAPSVEAPARTARTAVGEAPAASPRTAGGSNRRAVRPLGHRGAPVPVGPAATAAATPGPVPTPTLRAMTAAVPGLAKGPDHLEAEPARAMDTLFPTEALAGAGMALEEGRGSGVPVAKSLAGDTAPAPAAAAPSTETAVVPPGDEIIRVDFVPPRTRQVGEISVAALVMQPSRPIRRAEVRVRPESDVAITNAGRDGLIYRGELPANRRTTVAVRMEPRQPGAHDMRIELKTEVPAANTALEVHVAGFKPPVPAPTAEVADRRNGVNLVLSQTDIRTALKEVAEKAGVRVDMDPTVGGQRVNYSFHDVPAEAALRVLADEGGYRVAPDDGGWRITKP